MLPRGVARFRAFGSVAPRVRYSSQKLTAPYASGGKSPPQTAPINPYLAASGRLTASVTPANAICATSAERLWPSPLSSAITTCVG